MNRARKVGLALICAGVFSTIGCCYHGQDFGHSHAVGLGNVGCATCASNDSGCAKSTCNVCTIDDEGKRGRLTATASDEPPKVQIPRVVSAEGLPPAPAVNPNKSIFPLQKLPAETPTRDIQPKKE